ncbi:MAG: hypothetical protein JWR65_3398, partial [Massilia sp.]|nr:hypothetical protein [Massilia sp.]
MAAAATAVDHRAPWPLGRDGFEAVGVAAAPGLPDGLVEIGKLNLAQRFFEQFGNRPEQFGQAVRGRHRQVVDAHADDTGHDEVGRLVAVFFHRNVVDAHPRARAQGAHSRARLPDETARLVPFHLQAGVAARLAGVGESVLAGTVEALHRLRVLAFDRKLRRHAHRHRLFRWVVVAQYRHDGNAERTRRLQVLDAVAFFDRAGGVVADAAVGGAAGVLRRRAQIAGVGEQHHPLAAVELLETPGQAFFGQQAHDEIVIGFAILAAVT